MRRKCFESKKRIHVEVINEWHCCWSTWISMVINNVVQAICLRITIRYLVSFSLYSRCLLFNSFCITSVYTRAGSMWCYSRQGHQPDRVLWLLSFSPSLCTPEKTDKQSSCTAINILQRANWFLGGLIAVSLINCWSCLEDGAGAWKLY